MKILVTGAAGFIGMHLIQRLVKDNVKIIGIDNLNDLSTLNTASDLETNKQTKIMIRNSF